MFWLRNKKIIFLKLKACIRQNFTLQLIQFRQLSVTDASLHILSTDRLLKSVLQQCIIELLGHCKGGNFNNHIWAWFGCFMCSRREIRFFLFGKELISCLSCAILCAFHVNPDPIYSELTFINP